MHKENTQRDTVDDGIELVLFSHYMEILTVSYARGFRARESSKKTDFRADSVELEYLRH
jgi:hypothetical protein